MLASLGLAAVAATAPIAKRETRSTGAVPPRSAFLASTNLADVEVAPSGRLVAFLHGSGKSRGLWLLDTATGRRRMLARRTEASDLIWSSDGQWLFLQSERTVSAVAIGASGGGVLSQLGGDSGRSVLGPDRHHPAALLVREEVRRPGERRPSSHRVVRLTPSGTMQLLFTSRAPVDQFIAAPIRFARVIAGDHFSIRRIDGAGRSREVLRCVKLEQCSMLSSPKDGELLLTGDVGGNLERVLRLDEKGLRTVHQDPAGTADLAAVAVDPRSGEAVLASYRSTGAADYPVSPAAADDVAAIRRQLAPGAAFQLSVGAARWLVAETGDRLQHPRWHLYHPRSRRLAEILADVERPARRVDPADAVERVPITFRASDGMRIHGFVSLPRGRPPSRLPLVVHVHGGPWSHVADGFSTMTQFLASRGYAVFEPNFRGSTGHGRAFMRAGGQDFGNGRVQQDIVDGTRHLLGRGIGDPRRVGIIGSSFGGYAALQGVTFAPGLFRVAVAGMPPSDFGWIMRWQVRREAAAGHEGIGLEQSLRQLGLDPDDSALRHRLAAQSPLANTARLTRPLLIIAGAKDRSVPIRSVVDYAARLKAHGRGVTLFVDPHGGHRLDDPDTQDLYLFLVSNMLHQHLGGSAEPALTSRNAVLLRRNLRIDDFALGAGRR